MNSVELLDKRNQLSIQADTILTNAEKEQRKLNEDEAREYLQNLTGSKISFCNNTCHCIDSRAIFTWDNNELKVF